MRPLATRVLASCGLPLLLGTAGCRSPTQITVRVTTEFECGKLANGAVAVRVTGSFASDASTAATTLSTTCTNGYAGSLVIVPGERGDKVSIEVVASLAPRVLDPDGNCGEGTEGCIHARRALAFLPHTPLLVPIKLQASCAAVSCDPQSTCFNGQCRPAAIDPGRCAGAAGCDTPPDAPPRDAGVDSGAPDGGVAAVTGCVMSGLQQNAAWPMRGYCPTLRRRSPLLGPATSASGLKVRWRYATTAPVHGAAIDKDGDVYFGTFWSGAPVGEIHALRAADGKDKWAPVAGVTSESNFDAPVIGADGTVYFLTSTDAVTGLDPRDGTRRYGPLSFPRFVRAPSLTVDDRGNLYAPDNADLVQWAPKVLDMLGAPMRATGSVDFSQPAFSAGGLLYVGAGDQLNAIAPGSTAPAWSVAVGAGILGTPHIAPDGTVRVSSYLSRVLGAVDPATRQALWTAPLSGSTTWLAIADDGATHVGNENGSFDVIDANGKPRAGSPFRGRAVGVFDASGTFFTADTLSLYAYPPSLANPWKFDIPGVFSIAISFDRTLIVMTDTEVVALAPE